MTRLPKCAVDAAMLRCQHITGVPNHLPTKGILLRAGEDSDLITGMLTVESVIPGGVSDGFLQPGDVLVHRASVSLRPLSSSAYVVRNEHLRRWARSCQTS